MSDISKKEHLFISIFPFIQSIDILINLHALCYISAWLVNRADDEKETWGFLKVMFEEDGTARTKLLTHLGFNLPHEEKESVQEDLSQGLDNLQVEETQGQNVGYGEHTEDNVFPSDNGEDFFNNLPSPKTETPVSTAGDNFAAVDAASGVDQAQPEESEEIADSPLDDAILHALVVGDYKGAVAQCMSANKLADALVIAHAGGVSLWESTRDQFLKTSRSPYLKVGNYS